MFGLSEFSGSFVPTLDSTCLHRKISLMYNLCTWHPSGAAAVYFKALNTLRSLRLAVFWEKIPLLWSTKCLVFYGSTIEKSYFTLDVFLQLSNSTIKCF